MIAGFFQAFYALGRGDAARGDDQVVIAVALALLRQQFLAVEFKPRDFIDVEMDLGAQQRTFRALQLFLEEKIEGHIHEGGLVVVVRRIRQQRDADLASRHLRI
ncbi:hypothetical protein G6F57_022693 [Rhizopus arrhizus]|nr:hypothetical protein G6F57_022693 [Rhizopus arrhizus]